MNKPNDYRRTYVLAMDVPYRNPGPARDWQPTPARVCCYRGRVVWLQHDVPEQDRTTHRSPRTPKVSASSFSTPAPSNRSLHR